MGALARFVAGEIFFQSLLFQAAHAAKEIHFVRGAHIEIEGCEGRASIKSSHCAGKSLTSETGIALNARKKLGSLNSILRTRLLDPQRGDSQITIIC